MAAVTSGSYVTQISWLKNSDSLRWSYAFVYHYFDSTPKMARIARDLFNIMLPSRLDFKPFWKYKQLHSLNGRKSIPVTLPPSLRTYENSKRVTFNRRHIQRKRLIEKPLHAFGLQTPVDGFIAWRLQHLEALWSWQASKRCCSHQQALLEYPWRRKAAKMARSQAKCSLK